MSEATERQRSVIGATALRAEDTGATSASEPLPRTTPGETKILISIGSKDSLWRAPAEMVQRVSERWPGMRVQNVPHSDESYAELPDTDILVDYSMRPEQLATAKKLRWIHSPAAGVRQLVYPEMRSRGIVITNGRGVHAVPMAEHVIGMIIALARRFPDALRYQKQHEWAQEKIARAQPHIRELRGQVILIIGFGAIGRETGRAARAFGMRVRAVTRTGQVRSKEGHEGLAERVYAMEELDAALPEADFVAIAAPETDQTRHMIGAKQLRAMKPTVFLINVARGSLVDESALIEALKTKMIAGAGLDVTEQEPLPSESPLWALENVLITPHVSALSESLWSRHAELLLENLERWFSGRELLNRVSLEHGY